MMSRMIPVIIMMVCVASLAVCKDDDPVFDEAADRAALEKMEAQIDTLILKGTCTDSENCRSIAFGDKPCGGPWSYKNYSISGIDTMQLAGLVDEYNKFNGMLNERHGWMSDCMVVMPPNIDCVEGKCVAVE